MARWRGANKALREHSTAQDAALWNRDEIPPRLMSNMPDGKLKREDVTSNSRSTSRPPPQDGSYKLDSNSTNRSSPRSPWERHDTPKNVIATGKRKAGIAVKPPPARRRKLERNSRNMNLEDEEHMRQTLDLPTKEAYPNLPRDILDTPKLTLHNTFQGLMQLHSTFSQIGGQHFICHASCTIPNRERIEAMGEGTNKVRPIWNI